MGKGNGSTRGSASNRPRGLGNGPVTNITVNGRSYPDMTEREFMAQFTDQETGKIDGNEFSPFLRLSAFTDNGQMVNGGSYSIETSDGYTMTIDTENGYNENYGSTGTLINVYVTSPKGEVSPPMGTSFVEGTPFRESGGRNVYSNEDAVERRINGSMPYYAELANRWKRNH